MNEADALKLLLIKAIELNDSAGQILPHTARAEASRAARPCSVDEKQSLAEAPFAGKVQAEEQFLLGRAEPLLQKASQRYPLYELILRLTRWPRWTYFFWPALAFLGGLLINELGTDGSISILAFPFLGMLAWNFCVYALLLWRALRRFLPGAHSPPRLVPFWNALLSLSMPRRIARHALVASQADPPLHQSLQGYLSDWLGLGGPLHAARVQVVLHVSATALALGAVAGMYFRGLGFQYLAGWESTFLDEFAVHRLLQIVLGPASVVSGWRLPNPEALAAIRWPADGENAARWIHLYAITVGLFIVFPRISLAAGCAVQAGRARRQLPLKLLAEPYFRRLAKFARTGAAEVVVVIPYSFELDGRQREALQKLLSDLVGLDAEVRFASPVQYGDEEGHLRAAQLDTGQPADYALVAFNAASTPEEENQGRWLSGLRELAAAGKLARHLLPLLEVSSYRQRLGGQAGAEKRLEERCHTWRHLARQRGFELVALDLDKPDQAGWIRQLQPLLARSTTLEHRA